MGIIRWFKRLLGHSPGEVPEVLSSAHRFPQPTAMSAAEVLQRVNELQKANAQWPEIWQALNPDGDAQTQQLLSEFRGPYMFVPHLALNLLQIGCERALAGSPLASREQALREAMRADDQIVRPR
jgi:hypothetical protein